MGEADHHIGHLHSGVVNVILYVNRVAGGPQQPDEGIAENGIAQMPDVCRLVGINAGMFDQNLAADVSRAFAFVARDFRLRVAAASAFAALSRFRRALM